jgi:predicted RNA-binding Zn-ribbon protein involved in translation (DUF1610 family)
MRQAYKSFAAAFPEDVCLAKAMQIARGGVEQTCTACGLRGAFKPAVKIRAFACPSCGQTVHPCVGTPFVKVRTPLTDWFFAAHVRATCEPNTYARELERLTGWPRSVAERIAGDIEGMHADHAGKDRWIDAIQSFVTHDQSRTVLAIRPEEQRKAFADLSAAMPKQPARPKSVRGRQLAIIGGLIGTGIGVVGIVAAMSRVDLSEARSELPSLLPAPRQQTVTISAVEEDLAAAKAAVEFALTMPPSQAAPPPINMPAPPVLFPSAPSSPRIQSSGDPNQILTFGPIKIRRHIVETIVRASRAVGADPTLMMAVADKESSFATEVRAKTSSATGLYQFIERTWLGVIHQFGDRHGLAREKALITRNGNQFIVADPQERERILELRREPYISALLAAEMLKRDTLRMEKSLGRPLTGGEVYLIHFLGPDAAETFIETMGESPNLAAADLLPRPAEANRPIFYQQKEGETKRLSVAEVHRNFEQMIKVRLDRYKDVKRLTVSAPAAPVKR